MEPVRVVKIYELSREIYDQIMRLDMHAEDLDDYVNDVAGDNEARAVWHFADFDPTNELDALYCRHEQKSYQERLKLYEEQGQENPDYKPSLSYYSEDWDADVLQKMSEEEK